MKLEKTLSCLIAGVLACTIALAGIGCIDSAFGLYAEMTRLGIYLALWTAFCIACAFLRRGGTIFICLCAVFLGFLYREGTVEQEVESLLFHLSTFYNGGYGCGVIYWTSPDLHAVPVDGGLFLIGAAISGMLVFLLFRRKNELPALLAAIIPLGICLVVTDTIPSAPWLFLLLSSLALLLLTHPVRKKRTADGIRLTALLLIPVYLASIVLFVVSPQEEYGQNMNALQEFLINSFYQVEEELPQQQGGTIPGDTQQRDQVDLSQVGNREDSSAIVLEVLAGSAQTLYLREQSFDTYDGLSWTASDSSSGIDPYWPTEGLTNIGYVHIETKTNRKNMLLPYYIAAEDWQYDFKKGAYPNMGKRNYSYYQKAILEDGAGLAEPVSYNAADLQKYLAIPEQTKTMWKTMLSKVDIPAGAEITEVVQRIGDFVRSSAGYDLQTDKMPEGEVDFGLWFLRNSDGGYCVHFATAATMLLRAKGIPARYVTGFATDVQQNISKNVTGNESHAWVEYLDPLLGWQILEATPGFSVVTPVPPEVTTTDPTETEPTETTQPTQPSETTPPETQPKPTVPTEATDPTTIDPTQITDVTDPGQIGLVGSDGDGTAGIPWEQARPVILWVLGVILGIILLISQRGLRLGHRRRRMHKGEPNAQALARWRYILRLRRLLDRTIPQELRELAERAAFSQHTLTRDELAQFDAWLEAAKADLQEKPWALRWIYKWIFAIW